MDDTQVYRVLMRKRDGEGKLVRKGSELPAHVKVDANGMRVVTGKPVKFRKLFDQVNEHLSGDALEQAWQDYRADQAAKAASVAADIASGDVGFRHVRSMAH